MVERRRRKLETGGWLRRNKTRTRGTSRTDEFSTSDTQRKVTALWSGKVISVWRRQVAERRALMKEKSGLTGLGQTFTSTSSLFSALIQHPVCSLMAGCERLSDRFDLNPSGWYQQPVWAYRTYFGQMKTHRPARTGRMQHEAARLVLTHADHCTCRGNTLNEHNLPFFCSQIIVLSTKCQERLKIANSRGLRGNKFGSKKNPSNY